VTVCWWEIKAGSLIFCLRKRTRWGGERDREMGIFAREMERWRERKRERLA